ncbi:hypothetical protein LCGC14_2942060, partial [marine sediment metagenome]
TIKDAHKYSDSDYGTGEIAAIITGPDYVSLPPNYIDPYISFEKNGRKKVIFLDKGLEGPATVDKANRYFRYKMGIMDRARQVVTIVKGQIITPYSTITNEDGDTMTIQPDTLYMEVLEFLGYSYDENGWTDENQQIKLEYVENLTPEQQEQLPSQYRDDVVNLDSLIPLTLEEQEFYKNTVKPYFKNNPDILIDDLSVLTYRNLYNRVQKIKTSMTIDIYGFDTQDTFFLTDFKEVLKARWDEIFKHDLDNEFSSFTGDKKTQAILTYEHYIDNLYRDIFSDILEKVSRIDTANSVKQDFIKKFEESIQMAILDTILRDKLSIDDEYLTDYNKFTSELDIFLQNDNEINNLNQFFHKSSGINKVLDLFMANFLAKPL